MKTVGLFAAIVVALAAMQAHAQSAPDSNSPAGAGPLAGFGWFAQVAGACWKGEHPEGKSSDTQCYQAQHERLIRGTIRIMREGSTQPAFEGDAVFAVDPAAGDRVVYTQWGQGGLYSTGAITFEGDTLVFRNRQPDGKEASVRSVWRRQGADGYRVTRERHDESGWKETFSVEYRRVR